jgi:hypothetical protein
MGAKASESAADLKDQYKQRNVNKIEPQPRSSSSPTHNPSSQKPSSIQITSTTSHNKDDTTTHKVKMADRGDSLSMLLIILAMFAAVLAAVLKMGVSWKGFLMGGVSLCIVMSVSLYSFSQQPL